MKIRVSYIVDIDTEAWNMDFGVGDAAAVREDVKQRAEYLAVEQFRMDGHLVEQA